MSGERAKALARVIGISERVIDTTAEDVLGITQSSIVDFEDFQQLYFEIFSRVQPEPIFNQKHDDAKMSIRGDNTVLNTDYDN